MKGHIAFVGYLLACFGAIIALEAVFAAWWEIDPDADPLPYMAAGAVVIGCVFLLRHRIRSFRGFDMRWSRDHVIASSGVFASAFFAFLVVWGVLVREPWRDNVLWSAGGAAAVFAALVLIGYAERIVAREARKRGIVIEDYKPGRIARALVWAFAGAWALFLLLGLLIELGLLGEE